MSVKIPAVYSKKDIREYREECIKMQEETDKNNDDAKKLNDKTQCAEVINLFNNHIKNNDTSFVTVIYDKHYGAIPCIKNAAKKGGYEMVHTKTFNQVVRAYCVCYDKSKTGSCCRSDVDPSRTNYVNKESREYVFNKDTNQVTDSMCVIS